ncbi:MAG TPA: thioredoxin family protein [Candidatus Polarisedimenticolia bacterium]|jgi:thiol-disulfide isomerase/thioredoxin|nr:thioredoxin family protein [Candidatus Polarisedimenticolia bacterium]
MRRIWLLAAWVLASGSVLAFSTEAPTSALPGLVAFAPTSTYKVEVDGAEIRTAETFLGEPGLLILGCSLRFPVLVCPADQSIRYIPQENVIRDAEGNVSMKGTPTDPISSFQTSGQQIIFSAEGRKVRLSPKPALIGIQTLDKIIAHNPDYESRIKNYKPNEEAVAFLNKYGTKTEVQIYFGSWCGVCEAWVPRLVKSLQSANNPALQMQFMALPKNFSTDANSRSKGITGVPTIILVQNGREVTRLNGRPEGGTIEEAIVKLLRTASP